MSASKTSRVGLDGQIKRVFPHELKMTETNSMPSASMSASLPLTLIEQVPKGLYQATDWRDGGGQSSSFFAGQRRAHPLVYVYKHTVFVQEEIIKVTFSFLSNCCCCCCCCCCCFPPSFLPFSSYLDPTDLCLLNPGHSGTNKAVRNPHPAFPQAHPYFSNKDQNHRHYLQRANIQQPNISPLLQFQASKLHFRTILPKSLDLDLQPLWSLI